MESVEPRDSDDAPHRRPGTIVQRFWRWISPAGAWRQARSEGVGRRKFAAALALGVFIANLPVYGFQIVLSLLLAKWCRLHPLPVVAGAHLSTPPISVLLITAGIVLGHRLVRGVWPVPGSYDPEVLGYGGLVRSVLLEWLVGGVVLGAALAAVTYALTWGVLSWFGASRREA